MSVTHTLRTQIATLLPAHNIVSIGDDTPFLLDQRHRYYSNNSLVVMPENTEQVQSLVRFCQEQRLPIVPQGGNTGLVGGSYAQDAIIINLSKLNRIRQFHHADQAITVEAGCILQHIQAAAEQVGFYFPLSLASEGSCQIGGNIACNAGGLNVVRYGTMRDLVLGLEVVLPDGQLISQLTPLHKNTTGYDLKHLFIGSEGTLGIITAATLKLFAPTRSNATAWIGISSIDEAMRLLSLVRNHFAERLSSFELISHFALHLSAQFSKLPEPENAEWHILLELSDSLPQQPLSECLGDFLYEHGFHHSILAQSEQERQNLWTLRENISAAQRHLGVSIKHDIALPIAQTAAFVKACQNALMQQFADVQTVVFGHLGDGSLHYNVFLPDTSTDVYQQENAVNEVVYRHVLAHHGTIAAEHGIGCLKNHWLPAVRSKSELNLMRAIKNQFDPLNLFNPNKLLPENA
ncbi:MAG: FAD-binding oxidoreductase [Alysiella sp.]|uniref:FAD-binding oxidoreductase n=1 Tax=Alysiella sp. TaxID=1872483 RepID=UPI0026DC5688|nr:FAD-binding oxidoreductase [Alysiella sp.]MDO4433178.1 FAD-binding oxidoreductase [Alysiella sp.]